MAIKKDKLDQLLSGRDPKEFPGFDEKIVSMYTRAMTVREIQGHLLDRYGLEDSPDFGSVSLVHGARKIFRKRCRKRCCTPIWKALNTNVGTLIEKFEGSLPQLLTWLDTFSDTATAEAIRKIRN